MAHTPLERYFAERAFETVAYRDALVPRGFAGLAAEMHAARESAALTSLGWLAHVRVTGRHRARFIHNMTTCDVKGLAPGAGNFGVIVDRRGRVVADFQLDCEADSLLLELPRPLLATAVGHVLQFRVADDVHFDTDVDRAVLALVGPMADAFLNAIADGDPPAADLETPYAFADVKLGGVDARVRRNDRRLALPGWDITVAPDDAPALWDALEVAGAHPMGAEAWNTLRVEAGWPEIGIDLTDEHTPLESDRLYATVDWDKGCYVGQEVIAMTHYRGKPNKQLVGVAISGPRAGELGPGDEVSHEGKAAGRLGSVVHSPALGGPLALAAVKRKLGAPGTELGLGEGAAGVVHALPIVPAA